jgi:hypothetical protein
MTDPVGVPVWVLLLIAMIILANGVAWTFLFLVS